MIKEHEVIQAIQSGLTVTCYGGPVKVEGVDYAWQTPELRLELANGASIKANYRDVRNMNIESTRT